MVETDGPSPGEVQAKKDKILGIGFSFCSVAVAAVLVYFGVTGAMGDAFVCLSDVVSGTIVNALDTTNRESAMAPEPESASDTAEFVLPESGVRLYEVEELDRLSDWELYIARNEIFARHGRMFSEENLAAYFSGCSWYAPTVAPEDFDGGVLSEVETQNAIVMRDIEAARGSSYL